MSGIYMHGICTLMDIIHLIMSDCAALVQLIERDWMVEGDRGEIDHRLVAINTFRELTILIKLNNIISSKSCLSEYLNIISR